MSQVRRKKDPIFPIGFALRESLKGYNANTFMHDFFAAVVVSIVALPLSMALAVAVGLPPQHGIYTAVVAGFVAALLGGSKLQVSGPTAAFIVILIPIVQQYGLRGLLISQIMAGVFLVLMGMARLGRVITFVPYPVSTGFTGGIALVLATMSLNELLGLGITTFDQQYWEKVIQLIHGFAHINVAECLTGLITLFVLTSWNKITTKIPAPFVAIVIGTAVGYWLNSKGMAVSTLGTRFSHLDGGTMVPGIPPYGPFTSQNIDLAHTILAWPDFTEIRSLVVPAMVIALLAALESLLSATVLDGMTGQRHNPNAELIGIGFANMASAPALGIPATGAIARSTTNYRFGGRTPFASAMHALLIMLYVMMLTPFINHMPMASLAALLMVVAYHMSHYRQIINIVVMAPRRDTIVLLTCIFLTVFIDMVAGVLVGIVLASLLFMRNMSDLTETKFEDSYGTGPKPPKLPPNVMLYRIQGPLFFATAEKALDRSHFMNTHIKIVVIDMENVPVIDVTAIVAMESLLLHIEQQGIHPVLTGKGQLINKIVHRLPTHTKDHISYFPTTEEALKKIRSKKA
ncbi:MAG: STAS domain-containing protein [Proteobacteria bacterium]|nr:STAS domain-containing protein [Pseudomonadota bacterium]